MIIHARSEWTRRAPTRTSPLRPGTVRIVDVHWPASAGKIGTDRSRIIAALQGWQRMHMDDKRWSDIAYNVGVDLNGDVWLLRGWDVQDGGVAGRSDDVTVLAIMGAGDKVTTAMQESILWAMAEHERRRGRRLIRTYHGALKSTDCPGPALTQWAKAGFPAPTTTQKEDAMPSIEEIYRYPVPRQGAAAAEGPTDLWWEIGWMAQNFRTVTGEVSRVAALVDALAGKQLPPEVIEAAARQGAVTGASAALADITTQLQVTIDTAGDQIAAEVRDRLAAQVERLAAALRPEVTA